jgi:hypothetical protein
MSKMRLAHFCLRLVLVGLVIFPATVWAGGGGVGVSPASLSFGSLPTNTASQTATVLVTNNSRRSISIQQLSSSAQEFVVISPAMPIVLAPQGTASFQVVFRPDAVRTFSGRIIVTANRKNNVIATIPVSGTGTTAPSALTYLLSPSASGLNFSKILVGNSSSQAIAMTNTGTGNVNVSQVAITGAGFTLLSAPGAVTLSPGQSFNLTVGFAPLSAGNALGSLSVASNATNSPATISLAGTGIQPLISVIPGSVNFGNVTTGVANTQTVTITNPGSANLSITQASMVGTPFSFSGLALPLTVPPGASSAFTVAFTPASATNFAGKLALTNNSVNSPISIVLAGTGVSRVLQLTPAPSSLDFGSLTTGTSATQSVTLTNTGNSSVSVSAINVSGTGFSTTPFALPVTFAAGQSTVISAKFAPATTGSLSGSITVVSNAANSPLVISLAGSGAAPATHSVVLNWTPSSSSLAGFNVYRGTVSQGPYIKLNSSLLGTNSYTDSNVASGKTYYYVATEVDSTQAESSYSTEASASIP